jgi:hypothetical protein
MESAIQPKHLTALDKVLYDGVTQKFHGTDTKDWKCQLMHVVHSFLYVRDIDEELTTVDNNVLSFDDASIDWLNKKGPAPEYEIGFGNTTTFFATEEGKLLHKHRKLGEPGEDADGEYSLDGKNVDEVLQLVYLHTALIITK